MKLNSLYTTTGFLLLFQSSKRTLRSNELMLPPGGLLDTELELNFSLQVNFALVALFIFVA